MNAPPFPANPVQGQRFGNWTWSQGRWVCTASSGVSIFTQVFKASAPYTPSPGLISCVVECIGGGGAGGSAGPPPQADMILCGGGGGSGGYSRITLAASLVLGGVNVVIGDGGQAPLSGVVTNGQPTSFGALCIANGGMAGSPNNAGVPAAGDVAGWGDGGRGAAAGIGDIAFPGAAGGSGILEFSASSAAQAVPGGMGGQVFGGNQTQNVAPGVAFSGAAGLPNTGAGGMGTVQNQLATTTPVWSGSNGGSGICIVTEYCWADAGDTGCECEPASGMARVAWPAGHGGWSDGND
jgi:hypothetical protein